MVRYISKKFSSSLKSRYISLHLFLFFPPLLFAFLLPTILNLKVEQLLYHQLDIFGFTLHFTLVVWMWIHFWKELSTRGIIIQYYCHEAFIRKHIIHFPIHIAWPFTLVGSLASEFLGWSWKTHVGIPTLDIGIPT